MDQITALDRKLREFRAKCARLCQVERVSPEDFQKVLDFCDELNATTRLQNFPAFKRNFSNKIMDGVDDILNFFGTVAESEVHSRRLELINYARVERIIGRLMKRLEDRRKHEEMIIAHMEKCERLHRLEREFYAKAASSSPEVPPAPPPTPQDEDGTLGGGDHLAAGFTAAATPAVISPRRIASGGIPESEVSMAGRETADNEAPEVRMDADGTAAFGILSVTSAGHPEPVPLDIQTSGEEVMAPAVHLNEMAAVSQEHEILSGRQISEAGVVSAAPSVADPITPAFAPAAAIQSPSAIEFDFGNLSEINISTPVRRRSRPVRDDVTQNSDPRVRFLKNRPLSDRRAKALKDTDRGKIFKAITAPVAMFRAPASTSLQLLALKKRNRNSNIMSAGLLRMHERMLITERESSTSMPSTFSPVLVQPALPEIHVEGVTGNEIEISSQAAQDRIKVSAVPSLTFQPERASAVPSQVEPQVPPSSSLPPVPIGLTTEAPSDIGVQPVALEAPSEIGMQREAPSEVEQLALPVETPSEAMPQLAPEYPDEAAVVPSDDSAAVPSRKRKIDYLKTDEVLAELKKIWSNNNDVALLDDVLPERPSNYDVAYLMHSLCLLNRERKLRFKNEEEADWEPVIRPWPDLDKLREETIKKMKKA